MRCRELFNELDSNQDGYIDLAELHSFMEGRLGIRVTMDETSILMKLLESHNADDRGSRIIDLDTFYDRVGHLRDIRAFVVAEHWLNQVRCHTLFRGVVGVFRGHSGSFGVIRVCVKAVKAVYIEVANEVTSPILSPPIPAVHNHRWRANYGAAGHARGISRAKPGSPGKH